MEEITLEKIDTIRKRTGMGYAEAKAALEANNGNVVDTLISLEGTKKNFAENVTDVGNDLLNTVKEIIKKGNVNRIKIKRDNKALVDIPVNAGIAVGAISLFSPAILAIGAVTAIASKVTIEVERPDGSVEVINDIVKNTFDQTAQKAKDIVHDINIFDHSNSGTNVCDKKDDVNVFTDDSTSDNIDLNNVNNVNIINNADLDKQYDEFNKKDNE